GGKGKGTFQQSGGTVKVETIHRDGGSYELVSPQAQLWVKMGAEQLVHFLPEIPRSTRGEWTVFSHTR
ncbi:MAG: hypothetical protein L7T84_09115, partial [Akkermansiaceae bacterium]|nr:hypothetical protein [Akkermansiaceae bacterium]